MKIRKGILISVKLSAITLAIACATAIANAAAAPFTVTNLPATDVTANSAQLNGVVNPSGKKARYIFQTRAPGKKRFLRATPWTIIPVGQSNVPVAAEISGLAVDTTYEYRLVAMRGLARRVSSILTLTTAETPTTPAVATGSATGVGETSATLTGTASPNGAEALETYFEYGTTTGYGSVTSSETVTANGTTVTRGIGGLTTGSTYHYRIVGSNSLGVFFGADQSFVTSANAPIATTLPATAIAATTATLNGTVNPNNSAVTARFEYGTTTSYGATTELIAIPSGNTAVPLIANIGSLAPNTTYHFRVVVNGTTTGADQSFTTPSLPGSAPTVATLEATAIGTTTATLNATVNPNNSATTARFEYGTTTGYGSTTADIAVPAGGTAVPISANIGGLAPNTTYHVRVVASNGNGNSVGGDQTFTTPGTPPVAPTVATLGATAVASTTATLNATVNPNDSATTARFEYGTTTGYGSTTADILIPAGSSAVPISANIGGLAPNTAYHFRVVAINGGGTSTGGDQAFTTPSAPATAPSVTTLPASGVTATAATLNGSVNPNGAATMAFFEYGTTTAYGSTTATLDIPAGTSPVSILSLIQGLAPNTTYHFRAVAINSAGTSFGTDVTFTTPVAPVGPPTVTTTAATDVTSTTATINGTVNPNGAETTVYLQWGLDTSYGGTIIGPIVIPAGNSAVPVFGNLDGLSPGTTYHFQVIADNGSGDVIIGDDLTFTTAPAAAP